MNAEEKKYYSLGFKRALQLVHIQIEAKLKKSKERNPEPNSKPQIFNDGYIRALNHLSDNVNGKLKKLSEGYKVW